MPKLSFVVPAYNKGLFLAQTLKSLTDQTLKDIEIVVVNDGSTDVNSTPILSHFQKEDSRILVIDQQNQGRSAARNVGNSRVSSNIIAVCDADDLASPDRARVIYNYFKTHKDVDVFYSSFQIIDFFGRPVESGLIMAQKFDYDKVKDVREDGEGFTFIGHSTMAYRRRVVLDTPYDDGDYSRLGLDDWKLQLDLYQKGHKFGFTKKVLSAYRAMSGNTCEIRDKLEVKKLKQGYFDSGGLS